jgi:hypothetical protein
LVPGLGVAFSFPPKEKAPRLFEAPLSNHFFVSPPTLLCLRLRPRVVLRVLNNNSRRGTGGTTFR